MTVGATAGIQRAKHNVSIDISLFQMAESAWEGTDNFESKLLPEPDGRFVGGHDKVELHRAKTQSTRLAQRMLSHAASDAETAGSRRDHEPRIGYMRAKAGLVGPENVRSDKFSFALRDVTPVRRMQPVFESLFAPDAWIKGIGVATHDDRLKDIPDRGTVNRGRSADMQHRVFCSRPIAGGKLPGLAAIDARI